MNETTQQPVPFWHSIVLPMAMAALLGALCVLLFSAEKTSGTIAMGLAAVAVGLIATQVALSDLYKDAGREPEAERTLRQFIQVDPKNAQALNHLGYIYEWSNGRIGVEKKKPAVEIKVDAPTTTTTTTTVTPPP